MNTQRIDLRQKMVILTLMITLLIAVFVSLCIGAYPMAGGHLLSALAGLFLFIQHADNAGLRDQAVILMVRLPRVLMTVYIGIALGLSGAALQGIMRNPLVSPDLVGVSSGAACGGVLAVMLNIDNNTLALVALAFCGGVIAMICTQALVRLARANSSGIMLIVAGIFVGALFTSGVSLGCFLADDRQGSRITDWLLGTVAHATPAMVGLIAAPVLVGGSILMLLRWRINILSLGDMDIAGLGINPARVRWLVILCVSWMIAAQVAVSGVIGWVGLVSPHAARLLVGSDHRRVLPASALLGGLFTLLVDDFARVVLRADIPMSVLTTLIGTPFICFLFWKQKARKEKHE